MSYTVILAIVFPLTNAGNDDIFDMIVDEWTESPGGKWAIAHSRQEIRCESMLADNETIVVRILADLTDEDLTYWKLKYL
jgi:hypothetical protein